MHIQKLSRHSYIRHIMRSSSR